MSKIEKNIISIASAYVGREAINRRDGFVDKTFEKQMKSVGWKTSQDWCAYFVSLVWREAYKKTKSENSKELLQKVSRFSGSSNGNWDVAKKNGIEVSDTPQLGAIIVFTNAANKKMKFTGHTGIVTGFDAKGIYTIEGNTSLASGKSSNRYVEKKYRTYAEFGKPYLENSSVANTGKKRYLKGFILPLKIEDEKLIEDEFLTEEEILSTDTSKVDVNYTFSRDSGISDSGFEGIGDDGGWIIKFDKDFTLEDFLSYKGESMDLTNKEIIEQSQIFIEDEIDKNVIKSGTTVAIPFKYVVRDNTEINNFSEDNFNYDFGYIPHETILDIISSGFAENKAIENRGRVLNTGNGLTIWIYSKSLNQIIDISDYVGELDINCTKKANAFNFTLRDVDMERDNLLTKTFTSDIDSKITFFHKHISVNDIVFIQLERTDNIIDKKIGKDEISNKKYELIGLVDSCIEDRIAENSDISINVSGRDFSKLFEDDEALFFPRALTQNANGQMIVGTSQSGSSLLKRTFATGNYDILFGKVHQSIKSIFHFYLKLISNIGYLPEEENDDFFISYINDLGEDRREYQDKDKKILSKGIYQIIRLIVDENIEKRRVVDSNVGNPEGPFSSLFDRICQEPFVEYFTDTYGDSFAIIVRQPPFNYSSMKEIVDNKLFIEIEDTYITQKRLLFSQEFYTWFQLEIQGLFFGSTNQVSLSYCPIIQLDEYVNLWGSKRFSTVHNYRDTTANEDSKTIKNYNLFRKQAVDDLTHLVEINAHLPFTRTGSITLGMVDKRIKKGSFIKLTRSNEIFYVDSVQHSLMRSTDSCDGSTTLMLSRGMVEDYIKGMQDEKTGKNISYFNIVDLELLKKFLYQQYKAYKTENSENLSGTIINKEIFNFFLQKKQF